VELLAGKTLFRSFHSPKHEIRPQSALIAQKGLLCLVIAIAFPPPPRFSALKVNLRREIH
jgi:hypothetical protein